MPAIYGLTSLMRHTRDFYNSAGRLQIAGVSDSFAQLSVLGFLEDCLHYTDQFNKIVIVVPHSKDIAPWSDYIDHTIKSISKGRSVSASVFPHYSNWGADRYINPSLSRKQRVYSLSLLDGKSTAVIVTTLQALSQKTLTPETFRQNALVLRKGEEREQDDLASSLENLGYIETQMVEEEGSYALRGGILDVFPLNCVNPVRLEFFGDTLSSMRFFSASDQRSCETIDEVTIAPAGEVLTPLNKRKDDVQTLYDELLRQNIEAADRDGMAATFRQGVRFTGFDMFLPVFRDGEASGFDFLTGSELMVFPSGVEACTQAFQDFREDVLSAHERDVGSKRASISPDRHFLSLEEAEKSLSKRRTVEIGNPFASEDSLFLRMEPRLTVEGAPQPVATGTELFDKWIDTIRAVITKQEASVAILAHHDEQIKRINSLLVHRGFSPKVESHLLERICKASLKSSTIYIGKGDLASHLWLDENSVLLVPEQALFGATRRKAKPASTKLRNYLSSFKDLKAKDMVVHVQHGISRYLGMTELDAGGIHGDFLILEYHGGDKVYLPVDRLNLLQRYSSGAEGAAGVRVDKLGGPNWEKKKSRVRKAVEDMADDLLLLQAKRKIAGGRSFSPPDETYMKFEAEFPYEETEDQLRAISEVDADLVSIKPMDRLICGDVGFGKTEIALRATLRTVLEGLQVLILVPTTVLCYQHYRTFEERLSKFGINVQQVNRFIKAKNVKEIKESLEAGNVDVLIGTHRLLSKDIKPKRIGLLIIDEEQRFGVTHKEKLKRLREGAEVLTLTATPIPRTLHMSMLGLRDISLIASPPHDRLSIKTFISKFDEVLIKEAIEKEVRRGGQVFFVHNRVQDIEEVKGFVKSLVPHYDVKSAHGQMREGNLEKVIVDFLDQKFPILVCTTIIESGIDMPNVNTLIVNRADCFGLAQLYQLRGRVGRSSQQAYAYFFTPPEERISSDARKRLDVLAAHQELGAGFQIASYDLELRGAGNLLGAQQSGHVSDVGLEMYTEMLDVAINKVRGKPTRERVDTEIKIPVSAVIPVDYIKQENYRLQIYKNLFSIETLEELETMKIDVEDRFGKLPEEFQRLFRVANLKRLLRECRASRMSTKGARCIEIKFLSLDETQIDRIMDIVRRKPDVYSLAPDYSLLINCDYSSRPNAREQEKMLDMLIALVEPLALGLEDTDEK